MNHVHIAYAQDDAARDLRNSFDQTHWIDDLNFAQVDVAENTAYRAIPRGIVDHIGVVHPISNCDEHVMCGWSEADVVGADTRAARAADAKMCEYFGHLTFEDPTYCTRCYEWFD